MAFCKWCNGCLFSLLLCSSFISERSPNNSLPFLYEEKLSHNEFWPALSVQRSQKNSTPTKINWTLILIMNFSLNEEHLREFYSKWKQIDVPQNSKLEKNSYFEIYIQITISLLIFDRFQQIRTQNLLWRSKTSYISLIHVQNLRVMVD